MNQHEIFSSGSISAITSFFLLIKIIRAPEVRQGKCTLHNSTEGLSVANCSNNAYISKDVVFEVPKDIPTSIQVIDLSEPYSITSGFIILPQTFQSFSQLQRIIIKGNRQMNTRDAVLISWNRNILDESFQYIDTLEYLEFSNSGLNDKLVIHLPKNLKILNVELNLYENLNAHWSDKIREINANDNKLKNVPKLHYLGTPLEILRLKGNPLDQMTVLDIAPLCELVLLELNFGGGLKSYYNTEASYCDCTMLKQWAIDVKLAGLENVTCVKPKGNIPQCSDKILEDGRKLRKRCPILKIGDAVSSKLHSVLKYVFFFTLLLLLLAVLILYAIRHFHLKEFWAAHHMSQAVPIKMEEEEMIFEQESSSEESISTST